MSIRELLQVLKFHPETMPMSEKLLAGLVVTLLSMGVVFVVLVIIFTLIKVINSSPKEDKKENIHEIEEVISSNSCEENLINDAQLVAVITAAIMSSTSKNIVVKKIVRSNNNPSNWERVQ